MARAKISEAKQLVLRLAYQAGESAASGARAADCHQETAQRYFQIFRAEGMRRGRTQFRQWRAPVYTGPDWIG